MPDSKQNPRDGDLGREMHALLRDLFPICRSITGNGVRKTLEVLQGFIPLTVHEVPSGTAVFDWTVPQEWNISDAFIADLQGNRLVDFRRNNLHVVGYSDPIDAVMSLAELEPHLHSLPQQPQAIPYVTSYYQRRWGFCLTHEQRAGLTDGQYQVHIDSELRDGHLTYGELVIPGEVEQEILLSTYICHPSLANNELSGPVVATALARWIASRPRRFTYRITYLPETIGALTYLSRNLETLKERVVAGYNITCVGDDGAYSFLPSRNGDTQADTAARIILAEQHPEFIEYSYLDRGSDERQYCSPGIDLPIASVMRSKYGEYPEYHTSLDDLDFVSPAGLLGGFSAIRDCLELLERNRTYQVTCLGEPQLSRHGLFPAAGEERATERLRDLLNVLAYADGQHDLLGIVAKLGTPTRRIHEAVSRLVSAGLIKDIEADVSPGSME